MACSKYLNEEWGGAEGKGPKCLNCSNNDPEKFRQYREQVSSSDNELVGFQCRNCGTEYLSGLFTSLDKIETDKNGFAKCVYVLDHLYCQKQTSKCKEEICNLQCGPREDIDLKHFGKLKRGDHIEWHRWYLIYHHAIVIEVNEKNREVYVIEWHKENGVISVTKHWIKIDDEDGALYRVKYSEEDLKANPIELVIARAHSMLDETGYHLFTNNCENLGRFCKTGFSLSQQTKYLVNECKRVGKRVIPGLGRAGVQLLIEYGAGELVEKLTKLNIFAGTAVVIACEFGFICYDYRKLNIQRKNGEITYKVFIESMAERITEHICRLIPTLIVGVGTEVLMAGTPILGSICGAITGSIAGLLGQVFGKLIGPPIGRMVSSILVPNDEKTTTTAVPHDDKMSSALVPHDDKTSSTLIPHDITQVSDLRLGDQIVLDSGWGVLSRYHAIVICHNGNEIEVVRKTYKMGVETAWINYEQNIRRVTQEKGHCCTPEQTVQIAQFVIGLQTNHILEMGSYEFAVWCKRNKPIEDSLFLDN